jgi:ribosomal protein L21E
MITKFKVGDKVVIHADVIATDPESIRYNVNVKFSSGETSWLHLGDAVPACEVTADMILQLASRVDRLEAELRKMQSVPSRRPPRAFRVGDRVRVIGSVQERHAKNYDSNRQGLVGEVTEFYDESVGYRVGVGVCGNVRSDEGWCTLPRYLEHVDDDIGEVES